jgi:hypothetical protein
MVEGRRSVRMPADDVRSAGPTQSRGLAPKDANVENPGGAQPRSEELASAILRVRHGSTDETYVCGYFRDVLAWEDPGRYGTPDLVADDATPTGLNHILERSLKRADCVLLELDGRRESNGQLSAAVLGLVERITLSGRFWILLPDYGAIPPSARKLPKLPAPLDTFELLDLEAVTVPSASTRKGADLAFASRHARLLFGPKLCLVLWEEPTPEDMHNWHLGQLPHYGIPGSSGLVPLTEGSTGGGRGAALGVVNRIAEHNEYFLRNARSAIENAESSFFAFMGGKTKPSRKELLASLALVTTLEDYLSLARKASLRLQRRLQVSSLSGEASRATVSPGDVKIDRRVANVIAAVEDARQELRRAVGVVSASTTVVGLRRQMEDETRVWLFRTLVSLGAVAFSLVSVFLAIYGSNVRELVPGTQGDLGQVFVGIALIVSTVFVVGVLLVLVWHQLASRK